MGGINGLDNRKCHPTKVLPTPTPNASITRLIARCVRFFTLIQSRRFDTPPRRDVKKLLL
jgi:hypothetical protein